MKKEAYLIIGVVALGLAVFVGGAYFYKKSAAKDASTPPSAQSSSVLSREWSPKLGPATARVTLVEFLDPECEACRAMHPIVKQLLKEFDGSVHYVLRYMPFHHNSATAAGWLEAARLQNKYWEALDLFFEKQPDWGSHHNPKPELLEGYIASLGIDMKQAKADKDSQEIQSRIEQDKNDGISIGVRATPSYFVNGNLLPEIGYEPLRSAIEAELSK